MVLKIVMSVSLFAIMYSAKIVTVENFNKYRARKSLTSKILIILKYKQLLEEKFR